MKFDVPVFNEDGSVRATLIIGTEEAASLLQFAVNFLTASGLAAQYAIADRDENEQGDLLDSPTLN